MFRQSLMRKIKKMLKAKTEKETDFFNWVRNAWTNSGGLITQATARRLLKRSKGRVCQMIAEGKLKEYRYKDENLSFLSYPQVMEIAQKIQIKKMAKDALKEIDENPKVPEEVKEQIRTMVKESLEEGEYINIEELLNNPDF